MYFCDRKVGKEQVSQLPPSYPLTLDNQVSTSTNQKASQEVSWVTNHVHVPTLEEVLLLWASVVCFCFFFKASNKSTRTGR